MNVLDQRYFDLVSGGMGNGPSGGGSMPYTGKPGGPLTPPETGAMAGFAAGVAGAATAPTTVFAAVAVVVGTFLGWVGAGGGSSTSGNQSSGSKKGTAWGESDDPLDPLGIDRPRRPDSEIYSW